MKILPADDAGIQATRTVLQNGGIVAHATETCYGLACDLTNLEAVKRLFAVKCRPALQPVSGLFPDVVATEEWVTWSPEARAIADAELPGPLTLILPLRSDRGVRIFPTPEGGLTLGIRVSSHPVAQALAVASGVPLSTTSANLHGQPSPYSAEEIAAQYAEAEHTPDLILDSGTLERRSPSRILDFAGGLGTILRA